MILLDYMWKHLLFWFLLHLCYFWKFCTEDVYKLPYRITMKTRILGAQVQLKYISIFSKYVKYSKLSF